MDSDQIKQQALARIEEEELRFADKGPRGNDTSPTEGFLLDCAKSRQIGDARAFISLFKERYCYDHAANRWYQWEKHCWRVDSVSNVVAAVDTLIEIYAKEAKRWAWRAIKAKKENDTNAIIEAGENTTIYLLKIGKLQDKAYRLNVLYLSSVGENSLGISGEQWDRNPCLIACPNGILDLEKGEFRPGRPEDYIKTPSPTQWLGEDAPAPRWNRFLEEVFGCDSELIAYIKRLLGYGITGLVIHHILIILLGVGRNGKGTLLEILRFVLGPLVGPIQVELLLERRSPRSSAGPSPDIMALRGKRIVWASETDEGRKLNAGKVKWLTGGDTLVGRVPYGKREVSFPASHLLFLLTNFKPRANAADFALWQRIHLIPFKFCFVESPSEPHHRKADLTLLEELKKEASGILAWLYKGFREWQEHGLKPPPVVLQAVEHYRKEEDEVGLFIADCCVLIPSARTQGKDLYDAYQKWCEREGRKPLSGVKFGEQLKSRFKWRKDGVIVYFGIGLQA